MLRVLDNQRFLTETATAVSVTACPHQPTSGRRAYVNRKTLAKERVR